MPQYGLLNGQQTAGVGFRERSADYHSGPDAGDDSGVGYDYGTPPPVQQNPVPSPTPYHSGVSAEDSGGSDYDSSDDGGFAERQERTDAADRLGYSRGASGNLGALGSAFGTVFGIPGLGFAGNIADAQRAQIGQYSAAGNVYGQQVGTGLYSQGAFRDTINQGISGAVSYNPVTGEQATGQGVFGGNPFGFDPISQEAREFGVTEASQAGLAAVPGAQGLADQTNRTVFGYQPSYLTEVADTEFQAAQEQSWSQAGLDLENTTQRSAADEHGGITGVRTTPSGETFTENADGSFTDSTGYTTNVTDSQGNPSTRSEAAAQQAAERAAAAEARAAEERGRQAAANAPPAAVQVGHYGRIDDGGDGGDSHQSGSQTSHTGGYGGFADDAATSGGGGGGGGK